MICARYRHDFGPAHVFSVQPSSMDESDLRQGRLSRQEIVDNRDGFSR